MMNEVEFFEANKDKIYATAEFLCKNDPSCSVDEKYEELRLQYVNKDGTNHIETITINGQQYPIMNWLEQLRHEPVENFIIIAVSSTGSKIIYKVVGDQFSRDNIDLNDIDSAIITNGCRNTGLYIIHNHPFIYKASPSVADLKACEAIFHELERIEKEAALLDAKWQLTLIDFAIVTDFDYWSVKQS